MTTKKNKVDWRIVVTGLVCLTAIELLALSKGINGTILSLYIAIVAGAIGYTMPQPKFMK